MAETETFFIRLRGRVEGPFTAEKLRELATRGRFARHYEVSPDGLNWALASGYPGLFPVPTQRKIRTSGIGQSQIAAGGTVVERIGGMAADGAFFLEDTTSGAEPSQAETLWHYAQKNNSFGPVPFSDLLRLALAGQLQPSDLIWTEGMPEWIAASTAAPGLFEAAFDSSGNMLGPRRQDVASCHCQLDVGIAGNERPLVRGEHRGNHPRPHGA